MAITQLHLAPVLEIASILSTRGYDIEFGTLSGRESWLKNWPFVSRVHILGKSAPWSVEEQAYVNMCKWDANLISNWHPVFESKLYIESTWPEVYSSLKDIVQGAETRPDFILADYWVEAARDVALEHDIPLAMHWPQMPTAMLHAPHIPGIPGLQIDVITSEFATIWQRLKNAVAIYTSTWHYLRYRRLTKKMRLTRGVSRAPALLSKPEYLCLVNSFFGMEAAKDLPPNVVAVGPILSETFPGLTEQLQEFLSSRQRVVYISMGTHVLMPHDRFCHVLRGCLAALNVGKIDGVIWAVESKNRSQLIFSELVAGSMLGATDTDNTNHLGTATVGDLLNNAHPSVLFLEFAPQRALLHSNAIAIFISHTGPASMNEAAFAGVPLISIPVYFDQIQYSMRARDAGVSVSFKKESLRADEITAAITCIMDDAACQGPISINAKRLSAIAQITSRRKFLAADLIEEALADWEGRRAERDFGVERRRGMHLQTADARMGWFKARNLDLWAITSVAALTAVGLVIMVVVLPLRT
ncbi:UDP-glucosyl transferase family protein [Cordyceps javanica]|nr:UDP-glucosyl transferase family protein [Cordyceps javanica]